MFINAVSNDGITAEGNNNHNYDQAYICPHRDPLLAAQTFQ